ncbi:MAG: carboxypeptidase regulatory-like domain-containing protein [Archangium sp.]|nr:carboxypeptidase regulatory-like domain-containing protein [Archangium sp.]
MVVKRFVFVLLLSGCGLEPLSREQIFGLPSVLPKVRLTGTASDAATGAPLAQVTINVASASVASDADGTFTLDSLAVGDFDGTAVKQGYERKDFKVSLVEGTNRLVVELTPLRCDACGRLAGSVTDAVTGAPLQDVMVNVGLLSATTNASGSFSLEGLPSGDVDGSAVFARYERKTFRLSITPGANRLDLQLTPLPCGGCATGLWCEPVSMTCQQRARVSLNVVDDCTGAALTARVVIQGRATCTKEGRGFAELVDLTPGGPQTLAVGKTNYQAANLMVTLTPGFNALPAIRLTPVGGCSVTPVDVPCTCTTPDCQ